MTTKPKAIFEQEKWALVRKGKMVLYAGEPWLFVSKSRADYNATKGQTATRVRVTITPVAPRRTGKEKR